MIFITGKIYSDIQVRSYVLRTLINYKYYCAVLHPSSTSFQAFTFNCHLDSSTSNIKLEISLKSQPLNLKNAERIHESLYIYYKININLNRVQD